MDTVVTKVKDLIALLLQCDPEGEIKLSLDAALLDGDDATDGVEFNFDPIVTCGYSKQDGELSDRINIGISEKETKQILDARVSALDRNKDATADDTPSHPSIAVAAPVAIAVAVSSDTYENLLTVVKNCNLSHTDSEGANTHGELDVPGLLAMLAEDAAMTNSRPGSWEGSNMQQVLDSHGYQ